MTDSVLRMREFLSTFRAMDDATLDLLMMCVGRVFLNFSSPVNAIAPSANSGGQHFNIDDIVHVADWLIVSVQQNVKWLSNVDEMGRPKKLMKFSTFESIVREANKQMERLQKNQLRVTLGEQDEKVVYQLEEGWSIVQLLSPSALDLESREMQHCIGHGAYDAYLADDKRQFYSLRDPNGKAHATLEVMDRNVFQFQGKQNAAPLSKYVKATLPFLSANKMSFHRFGVITDADGCLHHISALPATLKVNGDLTLLNDMGYAISLPDVIDVSGDLAIWGNTFENIPKSISVGGAFEANWALKGLPEFLSVGGSMIFKDADWNLPPDFCVEKNLVLSGRGITALPNGLKVKGKLDISKTAVRYLPKDLKVGSIWMNDTDIEEFDTSIFLNPCHGVLHARGSTLKKISGDPVFQELRISSKRLKHLPKGLVVDSLELDNMDDVFISKDHSIGSIALLNCKGIIEVDEFAGSVVFKNSVISLPNSVKAGGSITLISTNANQGNVHFDGETIYLEGCPPEALPRRLTAKEYVNLSPARIKQLDCDIDAPEVLISPDTSMIKPSACPCSLKVNHWLGTLEVSWKVAQKRMMKDGNLRKLVSEATKNDLLSGIVPNPSSRRTWSREHAETFDEMPLPVSNRQRIFLDQLTPGRSSR